MAQFPQAKFSFQVEWQGATLGFSEVTGLDVQIDVNEYKEGGPNPVFRKIKRLLRKIPGLNKYTNITLKRGVFRGNPTAFYNWRKAVERHPGQKGTIRLSMRNENQELVKTWRLEQAWPVKIVASDLKADANEVAIETIEITCEGVKIE